MNTTLQPIDELDNLNEERTEQLREWLAEHGIRETITRLREEWSITVTYNKLQRYRQRLLAKDQVSDHLDHKMAMTEFLNLLNGNPVKYDEAGLALIQKRAFEAACAPKISVGNLATLQRVFNYKNVRADIEHRKQNADKNTALREAHLALSRSKSSSFGGTRRAQRAEGLNRTGVESPNSFFRPTSIPLVPKAPVASAPSAGPDAPQLSMNEKNSSAVSADSALSALDSDSVPCDHLGPLAKNWDDIRARARKKFGITPEESARRAELRRTWKNPNSEDASNSKLKIQNSELAKPLNIIDLLKDLAKIDLSSPPSGGTSSTSPTLISRDATTSPNAAPTEQKTVNPNPEHLVNPVENSSALNPNLETRNPKLETNHE